MKSIIKILVAFVTGGCLGLAFFLGECYAFYTSWRPLGHDYWQKVTVTSLGITTLTIDYNTGGDAPLWTIRVPCSYLEKNPPSLVFDHFLDIEVAGQLGCDGSHREITPDLVWQEWFKDAPVRSEKSVPRPPGITPSFPPKDQYWHILPPKGRDGFINEA